MKSLGDPDLMAAAEQMLVQSVLSWRKWSRIQVVQQPDCICTRSDIDFPFFNNVMCPSLEPESALDRIAQVNETVGERKRAVCWWVTASSGPDNLVALLERAGASRVQEDLMMGAELSALPPAEIPKGVEIIEVNTRRELDQWTSVVAPAHNIPDDVRDHWTEAYAAAGFGCKESDFHVNRHYLALMGDRAVGAATLITAAGLAGLANVATDPSCRGRGIGTAMTLWPLEVAKRAGFEAACLSASAEGKRVYARLGFRGYASVSVFMCRPQGGAQSSDSPSQTY